MIPVITGLHRCARLGKLYVITSVNITEVTNYVW